MKSGSVLVFAFLLFVIVVVSGCIQTAEQPIKNVTSVGEKDTTYTKEEAPLVDSKNTTTAGDSKEAVPKVDWKQIELADVKTGEKFKISDFKGKPIILESFAVWCPVCFAQQKQIKELYEKEGDSIIHISLDTDANEDEKSVREHITRNNFNWHFAVAPSELTKSLVDQFGVRVVYAPSAPLIIVCKDQSVRFLPSGVKAADTLKSEIEKGC